MMVACIIVALLVILHEHIAAVLFFALILAPELLLIWCLVSCVVDFIREDRER